MRIHNVKEKLLKTNMQIRRKHMLLIVIVLDPRFKLGHIYDGKHNFVIETLLNILESIHTVKA